MTKEELKQDAEKSLDKRLGTYAYIRKQDCYTNYVDGYIDGAAIYGISEKDVCGASKLNRYSVGNAKLQGFIRKRKDSRSSASRYHRAFRNPNWNRCTEGTSCART